VFFKMLTNFPAVHEFFAAQVPGGAQGGSGQHYQEQHSQAPAPHHVAPLKAKVCCRARFFPVSISGSPGTGITIREAKQKNKAGRKEPASGGVDGKES
jgi:hypothetical protein